MPFASMSKATSICGVPRGRGRDAVEHEAAEALVLAGQRPLALEDVDLDLVWLSSAVEKISLLRVGMVVLRGMSVVITPPLVSTPSDSGVTSSSRTSLTSPLSTPAWIGRADRDDLVRVDALVRLLAAEQLLDQLLDRRHPRLAADQDDLVDLGRLDLRVVERLADRLAWCARRSPSVSCSSLERVSVICRWTGPDGPAVMNGRLISVVWADDSSILAFSAASRTRCRAIRSAAGRCPVPS